RGQRHGAAPGQAASRAGRVLRAAGSGPAAGAGQRRENPLPRRYRLKLNETLPTLGFHVETVAPVRDVPFTLWDVRGQARIRARPGSGPSGDTTPATRTGRCSWRAAPTRSGWGRPGGSWEPAGG
ncbi:unnamed protein product, partial [Natator depressus]